MYVEDTCCCGVGEFDGLDQSPEQCIIDLGHHVYYNEEAKRGMYIFTDALKNKNGVRLAKYIMSHKELGTVQASRGRKNPNTGRTVKLWIYYPNWQGIKKLIRNN